MLSITEVVLAMPVFTGNQVNLAEKAEANAMVHSLRVNAPIGFRIFPP